MMKYILTLSALFAFGAVEAIETYAWEQVAPVDAVEHSRMTVSRWIRPKPAEWPQWVQVPEIRRPSYVCPTGDDNNPGTIDRPYASFDKAMEKFSRGGAVLLCRGGKWVVDERAALVSKRNRNFAYMGAYGEGSRPHIKFVDQAFFFENAEHFYFHGLELEGAGYRNGGAEAFRVWDRVNYLVINDVIIKEFGLGVNMTMGRMNPDGLSTHFAIVNSQGYWNTAGFIYGSAADQTFIDGNVADSNGGFGGAHNYYLAGHWKVRTKNYVFQRNKSFNNAPRKGKQGGGCSRGVQVAHGYIENLHMIDNYFEEKKGTSEPGCWGLAVDEGRAPDWGIEEFPGLVVTGNVSKYTGNLTLGITNANEALVGWNELYPDPEVDGVGFRVPNKRSEDPATAIVKGDYVHNKIFVENSGVAMSVNIPEPNLQFNEVIKLSPEATCYLVNGKKLEQFGTNRCISP